MHGELVHTSPVTVVVSISLVVGFVRLAEGVARIDRGLEDQVVRSPGVHGQDDRDGGAPPPPGRSPVQSMMPATGAPQLKPLLPAATCELVPLSGRSIRITTPVAPAGPLFWPMIV